ncbi:type IV secretion system protein VirB9 [Hephaestia caeni]|uniref:Type IV secretion system protein VirB9 n=1 Tax=Hephaestia caeni TaxID=645617 RepID=A0A397PG05_9SPHN|nr:P-type conjugative transfer protein TrbG [Hephaestia caeni]RIA46769.1 type IV secretion system protein VirB9 [Hephaestia caeni]
MTHIPRVHACALSTALLVVGIAALATPASAQSQAAEAQSSPSPRGGVIRPSRVEVVAVPTPLPLPGQLKPVGAIQPKPEPRDPRRRIGAANTAARVEPDRASWLNAIQQFPYADGALYQIYLAPGQVTDIALQEGEELVGPGPVAAGDTVRWIIGDTISGQGPSRRVHILVKPTRPDLSTNVVINTDRRTYHLELRATPATYMAAVSWTYPQDQLIALRQAAVAAERAAPVSAGIEVAALNFHYRIDGDRVPWRPVRVFDDGRQTYVEFPEDITTGEMPPVFVLGADGAAELVNYRVQGRYMVIDRLFDAAELRLGTKKTQRHVTIRREDVRRRRGS